MPEILPSARVLQALSVAVQDLLYLSESDAPFTVLALPAPAGSFALAEACALTGRAPNRATPEAGISEFFSVPASDQAWHREPEREAARRYRELRRIFRENLLDAKVLRCGDIQVDILIVGRAADRVWVGLRTRAVET